MRKSLFLVVLMAACSGCPPQPKPTTIDLASPPARSDMSSSYGFQVCPAAPNVTADNICDGWFTQNGLSCALCPGEQSCFDSTDVIYCMSSTSCAGDANCFHVNDGDDSAPGASSKRKLPHPVKLVPTNLKRKP